jgi:MFS family permease
MVLVLFKNPFAPHAAMRFYYKDAKALIYHTAVIGLILFLGNLCLWGVISKLFSFAFAHYHIIHKQSDLWKVYIAAGTAFFAGSLLLRFLIKSKLSAIALSVCGLATNILGFIFLLDLNMNEPVSNAFFYLGSVLTIFGGMWFITGTIVYYSQKMTDYSNQARNRRGFFMGLLNIADAFGRFIGPAVLTPIMKIQSTNQLSCEPTKWDPTNCTLSNVNIAIPINIALVFGNIIFFIFYHWNYGRTDFEASGSLVSHTSLSIRSQSQIQLEEVVSPDDEDVFVETN